MTIKICTPPWTNLRDLEFVSLQVEKDYIDNPEYVKWLNLLFDPGSSLGGARPKAWKEIEIFHNEHKMIVLHNLQILGDSFLQEKIIIPKKATNNNLGLLILLIFRSHKIVILF